MQTKCMIFLMMCVFSFMLINSCQAIDGKVYPLQIKVTTSCFPPFQSVCKVVVKVELTNIGNETFSGTLTIEGRTDKHSYAPLEYPISNLTKDAVHGYAYTARTDDEGTYWFTVKIEEEKSSTIELYEGSRLIDEGWHVEAKDSIFLHSFTQFLLIITGIVVPIGLAIVGYAYSRRKK